MKLQMSASQFAERIGKIDTIEHTASEKVGEAPVDGNEYVRKDGTWTKPDKYSKAEADETFLKKTETPTLNNVYTKAEVDEKLANIGSDVTSESVAQQISDALVNYVEKVTGKDLSSNDFTTELKTKLEGLSNYDDAAIQESLAQLTNRLDTLVGTSASEAIDTFNEIETFLNGITDTETLTGLLADLKSEIVASIPANISDLNNDLGYIVEETDPTVPDWAKQPNKPTYTAEEVGALSSVPQATDTVVGGIKTGYIQNSKNYPIQIGSDGKAYVTVPWTGGAGTIGVYLDAKPTEDTLTYTESDIVYDFSLGMSAIYPDSESKDGLGISFFKGVTSEGKAIWGQGGGDVSLTETVSITLVSNQDEPAVPDPDMIGKAIHVFYGELDTEVIWKGETIQMSIPAYATYHIEFPTHDKYKCPDPQEYAAVPGNMRSVNGYYYTEVVKVNVSADDKTPMVGQIVTIDGTKYTWNDKVITAKIPHGTSYTVSVNKKDIYVRPSDVTVTASQKTRELAFVYKYIKVDIIVIDQTISDPATMISGDVNGEVIRWIRNNSHRVLGKKTAEGEMTYCRLDDTDSNKFYDGSYAPLTGTEGDVFMKMPEFYYRGTEGDIVNLMFAKERFDDECIRWDPNILIGVYEAYVTRDMAYSQSGVSSTGNVSYDTWITYTRARGKGYQMVDWQMHCVMGCLYYAMYGNTNCQQIIGHGTCSYTKNTGQTDSLSMTDTVRNVNGNNQSINFWGLENWWGNKCETSEGLDFPSGSQTAYAYDPSTGGLRLVVWVLGMNTGTRYAVKMLFGRYFDLIPITTGGSSTTCYCDGAYNDTTSKSIFLRSYYNDYDSGGVAYFWKQNLSFIEAYNSSRLAFRGVCIEETDVEKFKAIEITN